MVAGVTVMTARSPRPDNSRRLKADYMFVEGVSARNEGRFDDALLLFDRAAALDPDNPDIAAVRGELLLSTATGDSAAFEDAYNAIKRRFLLNPSDADNGERFAKMARQLYRVKDVRLAYSLLADRFPARTDYALEHAWTLAMAYKLGDTAAMDTAMRIYDRLEAGLGADATIISHRIRALSLVPDTAAMLTQLHRMYLTAPADAENMLFLASTFYAMELPDSALYYIDRACELDSTNGDAYLARAEYYQERGDSAGFDTTVFRALESPELALEPKLGLLTNYVSHLYKDDAHQADISRLFGIMQTIHPGEAEVHYLYGAYLAARDSMPAAAEQFGFATDLNPDMTQAWDGLIQTAVAAGDTVRAIEAGREATRRFPDNLSYPFSAAALLSLTDGPARALQLLDSVDVSDFNNHVAISNYYTMRGDMLYKMELPDSAFAQYDLALEINPENVGAQNNAAYFMAEQNVDLPRARRLIESALHEEPLNPTYIDTYAWVLYKQNDFTGARRQIDAVLNLMTDSVEADTSAIAAPDTIMADDAVEIAEEIEMSDFEPSAEIYEHAGDIYYMTGEPDRAVDFWREALKLDATNERLRRKVKTKTL